MKGEHNSYRHCIGAIFYYRYRVPYKFQVHTAATFMYSHAFHTKKHFFGFILNFNDLFLSIPLTAILSVSDK